jgi:hypothetical protein
MFLLQNVKGCINNPLKFNNGHLAGDMLTHSYIVDGGNPILLLEPSPPPHTHISYQYALLIVQDLDYY